VAIVMGIPFALSKYGALKVMVVMMCAQIVASIIWDLAVESIPMTTTKVLGSLMAIGSILLVTWKPN